LAAWEDVAERLGAGAGVGIGIAAAVLAPVVVPVAGRGLRSLIKGGIKSYMLLTARTRSAVAEAGERLQDLYTDAKSEVEVAAPPASAVEPAS
jgi:uncharacterized protein YbjQ (UPF0145 family)